MARSVQRWLAVAVSALIACHKSYDPQAFSSGPADQPGGVFRVECWESEADCESDASQRCGMYKPARGGMPVMRGFKILGRTDHSSDGGRTLIVLDVQCSP